MVELVARKIETLRVDQPSVKVLPWEKVRQIVKEEVNPLLSERQLGYVFKCLANAGVVSLVPNFSLVSSYIHESHLFSSSTLSKVL